MFVPLASALLSSALSVTDPASEPAALDLIANHFCYASPGGLGSPTVDVAYAAEVDEHGLVWHRTTPSLKSLICFSTASPTGAPTSAPLVLEVVDGVTERVTAGPVITDFAQGAGFLVAWSKWVHGATRDFNRWEVRWVRPSGGMVWEVAGSHRGGSGPEQIWSMDLGASEESGATMVLGLDAGWLYWERYEVPEHEEDRLIEDSGSMWSDGRGFFNPSIARSHRRFIVFERESSPGGPVEILGTLGFNLAQIRTVFPASFSEPRELSHARAAGNGDDLAAIVQSRQDGQIDILARPQVPSRTDYPGPEVLITSHPASALVVGPALGQTGSGHFSAVWKVGDYGHLELYGASLERGTMDLCEPTYWIADDDFYWDASITDHDGTPSASALVGWGGRCDDSGSDETRGALVRSCW